MLLSDPIKSKKLGWEPQYGLAGLVKKMVASDLDLFRKDFYVVDAGHGVNL